MKYKIVREESSNALESAVQHYLTEGWLLYGFPTFAPSGRVFQAMVKYEEADLSRYLPGGHDWNRLVQTRSETPPSFNPIF